MSEYENVYRDFPERCGKIFQRCKSRVGQGPNQEDLSVTFSLMTATCAIMAPYEYYKLRENADVRDADLPASVRALRALFNSSFKSKFGLPRATTWRYGHQRDIADDPAEWQRAARTIDEGPRTMSLIGTIRNSLAHMRFYTRGDPIQLVIFANKNPDGGDDSVAVVSPTEFCDFLECWFENIRDVRIEPVAP